MKRLNDIKNSFLDFLARPTGIALSIFILSYVVVTILKLAFYDTASEFVKGIFVEVHGMLLDIILIAFLLEFLKEKGEKRFEIRRYQEEIDDFRDWKSEEATYRITGLIRRLNKLGVTKINLSECFLDNISYWHINLEGSVLMSATLQNANIAFAKLSGAHLTQANLSNILASRSNLENAWLIGANLSNADFREANFRNAKLAQANLTNGNFSHGCFQGADFHNSILNGANFEGADLTDIKILVHENFLDEVGVEKHKQKDVEAGLIVDVLSNAKTLFNSPYAVLSKLGA